MRDICPVAICAAVAAIVAVPCLGWGRDGHRIVGVITLANMSARGRRRGVDILVGNLEGFLGLRRHGVAA